MRVLAIDTSGQLASIAIVDCGIIGEMCINARHGENIWTHSEVLMPAVHALFGLVRLKPADIDVLAYSAGPGSFTGLRIGAACALGLGRALDVPCVAVPTLDALAANVAGGGIVVPLLDARRGQLYAAVYGAGHDRMTDYMAVSVDELCKLLAAYQGMPLTFTGCGADAFADCLRCAFPQAMFAPANNNRQRAASVGMLAMQRAKSGGVGRTFADSDSTEIMYIRAPQAVAKLIKQ